MKPSPLLMFFGDSITEGYMIEPRTSYPYLIEQKLESKNANYQVINEGICGDRSEDGLARIDLALRQVPDIFVLELGANDGLNHLSLADLESNLQKIIARVKQVNPQVHLVIAGMELPLFMEESYRAQFGAIFPRLAAKHKAVLIPFILEGVATIPELNLPDGIHPTSEGHKIIADNVWQFLIPILSFNK